MYGIIKHSVPLLLVAAVTSCSGGREATEDAVAFIGGDPIAYVQFEEYVREVTGDEGADLETEVLSALFDDFLLEEQLRRLALARGLVNESASRREALAALLGSDAEPVVDDESVKAYYTAHREEFELPERVRLRQILVDDRAAAERAVAELDGGADFGDVASRLSMDPSAPFGGDQGELSRDELPEAFSEMIFGLEPGKRSPVVEAAYGFHIFLVEEKLPAATVPLEEASATIRSLLLRENGDRRRETLVAEARSRYNVRIDTRSLPFSYRSSEHDGRSSP